MHRYAITFNLVRHGRFINVTITKKANTIQELLEWTEATFEPVYVLRIRETEYEEM